MRIRHKKHLTERLQAATNVFVYRSDDLDFSKQDSCEFIDCKAVFGNDNPVEIEVGCGKGGFICELAKRNPNTNYFAVERSANVIIVAAEAAMKQNIHNVYFLNCYAEYLPRLIAPHSIERVYLNFSCPFPKSKYAAHRLTNVRFLEIYKQLMTDDAAIFQKTDNRPFFDYSLEQYEIGGFDLNNLTYDLHNSGYEGNIVTEYEKKFSEKGFPICRVEARAKKN